MSYQVTCECGQYVFAEIWMAGTTTNCPCGRNVLIPSSIELRKSAGQTAAPLSTLEEFAFAARHGELFDEDCANCFQPATDQLPIVIECEKQFVTGKKSHVLGLLLFLCVPIAGILYFRKREDLVTHGRDTAAHVLLPVCPQCRRELTTKPYSLLWVTGLLAVIVGIGMILLTKYSWLCIAAGLALLAIPSNPSTPALRQLYRSLEDVHLFKALAREYPRITIRLE